MAIIKHAHAHSRTHALYTRTHKNTHAPLTGRLEPAGSHNSSEEEEYQTTGSFFCRGLEKHGHHHTAGALLRRTRDQPPPRFQSHVREVHDVEKWKGCFRLESWGENMRESSKPVSKAIFKHGYVRLESSLTLKTECRLPLYLATITTC